MTEITTTGEPFNFNELPTRDYLEQRQAHLKNLELEIAHLRGMKFDLQYFLDNWTEER